MKKLIIIISLIVFTSCNKVCDCTYYSVEREYGHTEWILTHKEYWNGCENIDFGYSDHFYPGGIRIEQHSYVICD